MIFSSSLPFFLFEKLYISFKYLDSALFYIVDHVLFEYMKFDLEWQSEKGFATEKKSKKTFISSRSQNPPSTVILNQTLYIRIIRDLQCKTRRNRGI